MALPKEARELVNTMLDQGATYAAVSARLAEQGHPHIKQSCLTRWFTTGFQDWLHKQTPQDELRTRLEFALKLAEQSDADGLHQATLKLASLRVFEILLSFHAESQTAFLAEHPENFVKFLGYLPKSCRAALDLKNAATPPKPAKTPASPTLANTPPACPPQPSASPKPN